MVGKRMRLKSYNAPTMAEAMRMVREAARQYVDQESGYIVNISSTSGLAGG